MQTANIIFQIIANISVAFGAIFAIFQYVKQKKLTKINKAIEISKYFATEMIHKTEFVYCTFLINKNIKKIIEDHIENIEKASNFNNEECKNIFKTHEYDLYIKFIKSEVGLPNGEKIDFDKIMNDVMNEFEHCCACFNTGIAADKAVYQSLHQVFLALFPYLYPYICYINDNPVDQYYTNLCNMYVRWNKIKRKAIKKHNKSNAKIQKLKNKIKKSGQVKQPKV